MTVSMGKALRLPFMSAVCTAVHSAAGAYKACQKGIASLSCGDVGGTAFRAADRVGFPRCTALLLL